MTADERAAFNNARAAGKKIEAIAIYRNATGVSLAEAKAYVEGKPFDPTQSPWYGVAWLVSAVAIALLVGAGIIIRFMPH